MVGADDMDLFAGAAPYYARYRLPYPPELIALLVARFGLDRDSRVLDLGTGTGQMALALAPRCGEVLATDSSAAMLAEARLAGDQAGVTNVRWLPLAAEAITPTLGTFRLATIAQAFHWMDREEVLRRLPPLLEPGGGLALLGGGATVWNAPEPWARAAVGVIQRWLGESRRAGGGVHSDTRASGHQPFPELLAAADFVDVQTGEYRREHAWDLDGVIGTLYSTSYCNPALLGERQRAFEADLRRTLLDCAPDGRYVQAVHTDYTLGWRPERD